MERKPSVGKRLALGCGVLIGLLVVLVAAAYFFLQAIGGRQVRAALARVEASGAPTTWEDAIPPPIPDDQNAAVLYEKAFAALTLDKAESPPRPRYPPYPHPSERREDPQKAVLHDYMAAPTRQDRAAIEKPLRQVLADNARALSYARQAVKRPKCRFNRDWSDPVQMRMPEYAKLKDLSRLASAQATLRADGGDLPGALDAWSLNLDMVKQLESDHLIMGQITRHAFLGIAARSLAHILEDNRPTPDCCRAVAQALGRVNLTGPFLKALDTQRAQSLWCVRYAFDLRHAAGSGSGAPPRRALPLPRYLGRVTVIAIFRNSELLKTSRLWEAQMALAPRPYRETVHDWPKLEKQNPSLLGYPEFIGHMVGARDTAIAEVGLLRTALGLAAYRTQFGRYPDSLDQLRKALKWEVPEDPFSGRNLIYRPEGAGYVLYSIGRELRDDGGKNYGPQRVGIVSSYPNIVWRLER